MKILVSPKGSKTAKVIAKEDPYDLIDDFIMLNNLWKCVTAVS